MLAARKEEKHFFFFQFASSIFVYKVLGFYYDTGNLAKARVTKKPLKCVVCMAHHLQSIQNDNMEILMSSTAEYIYKLKIKKW